MKQPVWILNSFLLVLFFISQTLLFMLQRVVPRRISITPGIIELEQEITAVPVDITRIYQQDLFGTYEPAIPSSASFIEDTVPPIPQPPKLISPDIPVERAPTFFAPLDVVLKGVIFVKDDPAHCIAIVQLKKTKEEQNYQVGDLIEDAQILKILSNRIIIVRSNGQQETLYLREEDAASDFNTEMKSEPKLIVEDVSDNKYIINIDEFVKRIHNLGQFINLLDLTTVYKEGKSFGCRVGRIEQDSLGSMLGFMIDDIIIKVDECDVDDLAHRIEVYDHIVHKHPGDMIDVLVSRGNTTQTLRYALVDNQMKAMALSQDQLQQNLMQELDRHEVDNSHTAALKKDIMIQGMQIKRDKNTMQDNPSLLDNGEQGDLSGSIPDTASTDLDRKFKDDMQNIMMRPEVSSVVVQSLPGQTLNEADTYKKRIIQEKDKLSSTISKLRTQDKNNMMRRNSKNIIFNGMQ